MSTATTEFVPTINRQWALDVNTSATATPAWTAVRGVTNFVPSQSDQMADDTTYDDGIWTSMGVQSRSWAPTVTVRREIDGNKAFDAGQEALRKAADSAIPAHIRYYNQATPKGEAYEGIAQVGWSPAGGAGPGWQEVSVTLTGRGERKTIFNPSTPTTLFAVSTAYALGAFVRLSGGAVLEVTTAGTSGTVEPAAPAAIGGTVVSGTVTFTRRS